METQQSTFRNLAVLEQTRQEVKGYLLEDYNKRIEPFIEIINKVATANNINEFEALKLIKDNLEIYNKPGAAAFFSAALMDIVEEKRFADLPKEYERPVFPEERIQSSYIQKLFSKKKSWKG